MSFSQKYLLLLACALFFTLAIVFLLSGWGIVSAGMVACGCLAYLKFTLPFVQQERQNDHAAEALEERLSSQIRKLSQANFKVPEDTTPAGHAKDSAEAYLNLVRARSERQPWFTKLVSTTGVIAFLVMLTTAFFQTLSSNAQLNEAKMTEQRTSFLARQAEQLESDMKRAKQAVFQSASHLAPTNDPAAEEICSGAAAFYPLEGHPIDKERLSDYILWGTRGNRWDVISDIGERYPDSLGPSDILVTRYMLGDFDSEDLSQKFADYFSGLTGEDPESIRIKPGELIQIYGIYILLSGRETSSPEGAPNPADLARILQMDENRFKVLAKTAAEHSSLQQKRFRRWRRQME